MKHFIIHMKECISLLYHIADCIEKVHKDTTIANIAGSTAGIAGGITAIVGLALIPVTLGASVIVSAVGGAVAAAGGLTGAGSSIVDFFYIKKQCSEAEKILKAFMNDVKCIKDYLSNIDIQLEAIKSLFGENTSEYSRFTNYLLKFYLPLKEESLLFISENEGFNALKQFADLFNFKTLTALVPSLIETAAQAGSSGAKAASSGAQVASSGAQVASRGAQVASRGAQAASRGAQIASSEAQIASSGVVVVSSAAKAAVIASGVFVALGLVIDIVFLVKNSKHLHEGAKTAQAAAIRSIASALEKDSKAFEGKNVQENCEMNLHEGTKSEQESKTERTIGTTLEEDTTLLKSKQ
ncbi:apolipoprotein L3 [Xenopus tropicalis]|nr:apolipoprotein L3 [Xenopus tropicalis]